MKIGLDPSKRFPSEAYPMHLLKVLRKYVPEYDYTSDKERYGRIDIYHGFKQTIPLTVRRRAVKKIITLPNLNFVHYPWLFGEEELKAYHDLLSEADRVITFSATSRETLAKECLLDLRKIEVIPSLSVQIPHGHIDQVKLDIIRHKYALPKYFIFMYGGEDPRGFHRCVFEAMPSIPYFIGLVVCGRRSFYSDALLDFARTQHFIARVNYLYEPRYDELPVLLNLARVCVVLSDDCSCDAAYPIVEALRSGIPLILSDTPTHRELARDAAIYVDPSKMRELVVALNDVLHDQSLRGSLLQKAAWRSVAFSERTLAGQLKGIYASLSENE